jgi:hypothetical protein
MKDVSESKRAPQADESELDRIQRMYGVRLPHALRSLTFQDFEKSLASASALVSTDALIDIRASAASRAANLSSNTAHGHEDFDDDGARMFFLDAQKRKKGGFLETRARHMGRMRINTNAVDVDVDGDYMQQQEDEYTAGDSAFSPRVRDDQDHGDDDDGVKTNNHGMYVPSGSRMHDLHNMISRDSLFSEDGMGMPLPAGARGLRTPKSMRRASTMAARLSSEDAPISNNDYYAGLISAASARMRIDYVGVNGANDDSESGSFRAAKMSARRDVVGANLAGVSVFVEDGGSRNSHRRNESDSELFGNSSSRILSVGVGVPPVKNVSKWADVMLANLDKYALEREANVNQYGADLGTEDAAVGADSGKRPVRSALEYRIRSKQYENMDNEERLMVDGGRKHGTNLPMHDGETDSASLPSLAGRVAPESVPYNQDVYDAGSVYMGAGGQVTGDKLRADVYGSGWEGGKSRLDGEPQMFVRVGGARRMVRGGIEE